jgi:hypothetical protein
MLPFNSASDAPLIPTPTSLQSHGEWYLEEVEVTCSPGSSMATAAASEGNAGTMSFPCMDLVGGRDAALELRPSEFKRMTAEQRAAMREEGLREYGELKFRMLAATGASVVLGCGVTAALSHGGDGLETMKAFASGGGVGLIYLYMLTRSVDTLGGGAAAGNGGEARPVAAVALDAVTSFASSGPMRLLLLGLVGAAAAHHVDAAQAIDATGQHTAYGEALAAVLGFFTYKAGVLVAGFSGLNTPPPSPGVDASNNISARPVPIRVEVDETRSSRTRSSR